MTGPAASFGRLAGRLRPGKASSWLPAVALFLCLALFAMAALVLLDVGADPESPQSASVTAVSAQGFQGLRRLLDARGTTTLTNRFQDGPNAVHGDLEIVTLDTGPATFDLRQFGVDASSQASDDSAQSEESSESSDAGPTPDPAVTRANADALAPPGALDQGFFPSPAQSAHLLYHPLGRAVIVVAPKWQAGYDAKNARWATDAQIVADTSIRDMLTELSPETETPSRKDKDDHYIRPAIAPGQNVYYNGKTTVIYDKSPYVITHGPAVSGLVIHRPDGSTLAIGAVTDLQSITGPNLIPVLFGPHGEALMSRVVVTGGRKATAAPVYLVSDPDLLDNQILADPRKVVAAMALIDGIMPPARAPGRAGTIVFNLTFNGMTFERNLLHALSRPPYIGVPLSLLILGLGLMWAAFSRFGPPRHITAEPPLGRGVRVLADNAARLMALTVRESRLAPAYAILMRDLALKGRGYRQPAPSQSLDDLADRLGSMCRTTHAFADLQGQAAQVATVHQLIDLTLKLHAWKTEIERAHI